MSTTTEKVIEKIRKLFAMAEHANSNEQEAATAARQAEALLRKHNLSQSDITPEEARSNVQENPMAKYKWTAGRAPLWAQALAIAIADAHDTFVVWRRAAQTDAWVKKAQQHLTFVGAEADCIVSGEAFNYLFVTINRLCDEYFEVHGYPAGRGKTYKNSYRDGMATRFVQRFKEMSAEKQAEFAKAGTALVVIKKDAISDYLGKPAEYQQGAKRQTQYDPSAYQAGYEKAGSVSLNKQLR